MKKETEQNDVMENAVAERGVSSSPTSWEAVALEAAAPETVEIVDPSRRHEDERGLERAWSLEEEDEAGINPSDWTVATTFTMTTRTASLRL